MAFFSQMGGAPGGMGMGMGMGGSPSAFTSPGMDPMTLQLLLRMQKPGAAGAVARKSPQPPMNPGGSSCQMMGRHGRSRRGRSSAAKPYADAAKPLGDESAGTEGHPGHARLGGGAGGGGGSPMNLLGLGNPGGGTGGLY
jgi:hypothetical protein